MPEALLTERDILIRTGWPTVRVIAKRIRSKGFPRPCMMTPDMGPQWRERDVDRWMGVPDAGQSGGVEMLLERFK